MENPNKAATPTAKKSDIPVRLVDRRKKRTLRRSKYWNEPRDHGRVMIE